MTWTAATTTFLLTEVVDSVAQWESDEPAMAAAGERLDGVVRRLAATHGGTLVKPRGEGDSHFLVFDDPVPAVACAADLQRAAADDPRLSVRAAIHVGPAAFRSGDWYGSTVNRCARLRAVAHGRQVVTSAAVADAVAGRLAPGLSLVSLGRHRLKDLDEPAEVFQLVGPGLLATHPPLSSLPKDAGLPRPATPLVGRDTEVAGVVGALGTDGFVTVTGAAGVGKSRVALEAATRWAADHDAPVVRPGGHPSQAPGSLLYVDDADHTDVVEVGTAHRGPVLLSGRAPLVAGAGTVVRLAPLDPFDSERLLEERTGRADLRELVGFADGLPLALELLARRAGAMSIAELRARLETDPLTVLGGNRRADPARHASLEAALSWSWDRLDGDARAALLDAAPGDVRWVVAGWHEPSGVLPLIAAFLDRRR